MTEEKNMPAPDADSAPDAPFKSGFVALIGRPNVGKSTLMNHLIGQKIAITSDKPQTTRNRIQTVYTDERGQIVFLDTPGMHEARTKLGDYMVAVAEKTLGDADVILWLVEPEGYLGKTEKKIRDVLANAKVPVFIAMNKTDAVGEDVLFESIKLYSEALPDAEVVPVSALKERNLDTLLQLIFDALPEGPQYYDEETVTEIPMREIAAELIREKALRLLKDEVPHGIAVEIEQMKEREDGIVDIHATIVCEKDSHKGIVIGKGGTMLKRIGTAARRSIEAEMETQVNLKLWVKVRKDWRDSDLMLKGFGYDKNRIQ